MDTSMPTDGPEDALFRIARKLRLRYSKAFVVQAISAHPRPTSLLALVEVAGRMGIRTTPAETDASHLAGLKLPAVVHFSGSNGGGFGVLEGVSGDRFHVWDSGHGQRAMDRDVFLSSWSGVIVPVERAEVRGAVEHRYARQRFLEIVAGATSTPAVADGRAAPFLRTVLGGLAAALLVAAIATAPSTDRVTVAVVIALAAVGLAVTVLMAASTSDQDNPIASRICRRGKLVDCHGVLTSRYSRIFGLPLSDVGMAFYGAILLLLASTAWVEPPRVWPVVVLAFVATLPFAALLMGLQISMRQLCTLCLASHVVNVSAAVLGWLYLWNGSLDARSGLFAILLALYFGIVLFVVIPYFRRSVSLTMISDRHRKMASSPFGTLAALLAERSTDVSGPSCGISIGAPEADHEVVVLVHPGCGKCYPVLREAIALSQVVPLRIFVGVAPKDPDDADRYASSVLVAAWNVVGPNGIIEGYGAAKRLLGKLSGNDAPVKLAEELGIDPGAVGEQVSVVRPLVEHAERAVDAHADGTPAIFVDSRPFPAPLAHLAYLIQNHPELVRLK